MIRRLSKGIAIFLALIMGVTMVRAFAPAWTPALDADGRGPEPTSIAVSEIWKLNGSDQAVVIRGRDVTNPVLVWVGDLWCETPVLRHFNSGLEDHFVVVYWCQRHTGRLVDNVRR